MRLIICITIALVLGFITGHRISTRYKLTMYSMILLQLIFGAIYYGICDYIYGRIIPGSHRYVPSDTPNIQMFTSVPQSIPTTGGTPITPSKGGTTATPTFGMAFTTSINTTVLNPGGNPVPFDYAPLVKMHSIVPGDTKLGDPVLTIAYLPEGNLIQAILFHDGEDTRISLGTPPIKKNFTIFLRTRPSSPSHTSVEIYVDGTLRTSSTVRSSFFGGSGGGIIPAVGYDRKQYPAVDAEIQNINVWGDASEISTADIQGMATQHMDSTFESKHIDTTRCNN